jgi:hypothetical protein
MQADFPQRLGADEVGAFRQRFHDAFLPLATAESCFYRPDLLQLPESAYEK